MKIKILGGGPAGLYFAILTKLQNPSHDITLYEKNAPGVTFGWGVVFSDATLEGFLNADPITAQRIQEALHHWDDIDISFKGETIRSSGHGFSGIARKQLLDILTTRAQELGVHCTFNHSIEDFSEIERERQKSDLIVAADGIFSKTREHYT